MIPVRSVDAFQDKVIDDSVDPVCAKPVGTVGGEGVTTTLKVWGVPWPTTLLARTDTGKVPTCATVGIQEIAPVMALIVMPGGAFVNWYAACGFAWE